MAVNLLEMAKGYLTDAVISRLSGSLNENPENIQKALTGALPVFLSGLISRSSSSGSSSVTADLIQQFMADSSITAQSAAVGSDDPDRLMDQGGSIVDAVFGANSSLISGALAQFSGVKTSSASGLLALAGSVITGLLGRLLTGNQEGVTIDNLPSLLAGQRDVVASGMPSGLVSLMGDMPGFGGLSSLLGGLSGAESSAVAGATGAVGAAVLGATGGAPANEVRGTISKPTPAYSDDINNQSKKFNFWPWLLAAVVAALILYFVRGCGNSTDTATISTTNDTTSASVQDATANMDSAATSAGALIDSASSSVAAAADGAGDMLADATAALGTFGPKKLPDGVELTIPANGIENKLLAFIEDQSKVVDKTTWFNFDRLLYETGSATLKPESREQLQNIAAILKAYPMVNLKIGGYTDNTGNAAANKKLSQSRAESAMTELVRLGVSQARLEAEGYGIEHPVASNKTEEGRTQNRRTAVRVTKK